MIYIVSLIQFWISVTSTVAYNRNVKLSFAFVFFLTTPFSFFSSIFFSFHKHLDLISVPTSVRVLKKYKKLGMLQTQHLWKINYPTGISIFPRNFQINRPICKLFSQAKYIVISLKIDSIFSRFTCSLQIVEFQFLNHL